jgi:hypothetical protein
MVHPWLFSGLFILSRALTAGPAAPIPSAFKIVYSVRIYQAVGPSHEQWREMIPPDLRSTPSTETRERCASGSIMPSQENQNKAERLVGQHGKLLTWSDDATMFAYVDRNPSIPPPKPNPWGCDDCFYPELKVVRAANASLLATIRLPEFGDHWNYPTDIEWSPDARTLLVGAEAGSSDSHYSNYWLLDWMSKEWRDAGGGNSAKWSPDGSEIAWKSPRRLEPLGKLHVWVANLTLLDVRTLKQQILTPGVSVVSEFYWCAK